MQCPWSVLKLWMGATDLVVLLNQSIEYWVKSGRFLVSRMRDAGWSDRSVKVTESPFIRSQKRSEWIMTVGRWPWKSGSAKDCVTTHLPNSFARKMDVAETGYLYWSVFLSKDRNTSRRARRSSVEAWVVRPCGAISGVDLSGSSNYSSENLEDWSWQGFRGNRNEPRVSRA